MALKLCCSAAAVVGAEGIRRRWRRARWPHVAGSRYDRFMAGSTAARGDIYNVHPDVSVGGDSKATPRRMVCVAENRFDEYAWKAMARTTTAPDESIDLFSPERQELGLTKDGWWSYRFLRSVKKRWTGHATLCAHLSTLPEPLRTEVLTHYMKRPKPSTLEKVR